MNLEAVLYITEIAPASKSGFDRSKQFVVIGHAKMGGLLGSESYVMLTALTSIC